MVYSSPIFGQVSPFGAQQVTPFGVSPLNQINQIQAIKQQVIAQAYQTLATVEQVALQQVQNPHPHQLQQLVYVIEQQKQQTQAAIQHLVQTKLQLLSQGVTSVQTPVHRQQVEQAVQRLVQLAQIKQQIRQLLNEAKNTPNPQQIHDNAKQVLELAQLAKLVLAQVQQNQYNQINFGNWAQTSLFSINPFTTGFNTYGYQGLFGQQTAGLIQPTVVSPYHGAQYGQAGLYNQTSVYGQSPIFGQYNPLY
ncbi:hypothetical protein CONCODRAFT_11802 [Conidiobolus coronatus NRRL 28638]|uniref:Uncharacterized protein n=1 Tax=Conidiobolus coronatus (strain ATCC 28846 / CBS 209.66 / NRRL 28638) TaxID=796925 RepID=A0A137NUH1_CONC2|nr:hypothetical protein CONCODRAFT_11802 [Conidiobolus coronatus NRRL 28638]|eukprot:KXN66368.1 hypothetical protein CONCODRAFT_11802 [Conidiobolus coronatus NRRL 28638]